MSHVTGLKANHGGHDNEKQVRFAEQCAVIFVRIGLIMNLEVDQKRKIIVLCILALHGVGFFFYGVLFHSASVSARQDGKPVMVAKSESTLIKDASVSGVKRDETGKIKQTYEIGEKAPEACST